MIYSLRRVFAPCERPMAAADDTGHMDRINVPRTECLNDDRSGIFLVIFFHLRARERARAMAKASLPPPVRAAMQRLKKALVARTGRWQDADAAHVAALLDQAAAHAHGDAAKNRL